MTGTRQNAEFIIFVTHVEADDVYLKIWGQVDKAAATRIERMIVPLSEQFARGHGRLGPQSNGLAVDALCCAKFQNDGYYRAKIRKIRPDGTAVLEFIDYGNVEVKSLHDIHILADVPGSEALRSFPPIAVDFTLINVLPINGIWENETIDSIKTTLRYNEYKVLFHSMVDKHRLIKLCYSEGDFAELLVNKHMAIPATLQEMFRPPCVQHTKLSAQYQQPARKITSNHYLTMQPISNIGMNHIQSQGNTPQVWQNFSPPCVTQQKPVLQEPIQEALVFKSRVLDVGSTHDVFVSFVEDGPQKFSVQVQSTSEILSKLMREINNHPTEPLQEPPLPGSVCLGRYTQDKVLCRAVVMSVMENKCKLYYVDFGHTEVLPYTDIFQLPPHYINPRVLSIRFTLSGVKDLSVTDEMKEYFKKIVSGISLMLHVRPPEGPPLIQYGDLYNNGRNIKDILRDAFSSPVTTILPTNTVYREPCQLKKGTEEIVYVSFVESCVKFFVQLDSCSKLLESIMTCLAEYAKTAPSLNLPHVKIGLPCAALYDTQWYRAQILNVDADRVQVLYVDYGNEETVSPASLRVIREDLVTKLPAQAIRCIWSNYDNLLDKEITNQFETLTLEKRLYLNVIDVHPEGLLVDLYDPERMESIKSQICRKIGMEKPTNFLSNSQQDTENTAKYVPKHMQSEDVNKQTKKNQQNNYQPMYDSNTVNERNKSKTWKNEVNEEKQHDNKSDKSNFQRDSFRNDRSNRDTFRSNKFTKDEPYKKYDQNETTFNRSSKETRGSRNRFFGNESRQNRSSASDKSLSDKDSDTSSRSSSKRGRGSGTRGARNKHEGISGRIQNSRWPDRDNERNNTQKNGKGFDDHTPVSQRTRETKRSPSISTAYRKVNGSWNSPANKSNMAPERINKFHISKQNISLGIKKSCEVVFVNGPSDFYVQLSPDCLQLDPIMESIASVYENNSEILHRSDMQPGTYCVAQYTEDLTWYRAVIQSVEDNTVTVQFVDYGNTESVTIDKVKNIKREFIDLPIQAVHCKLLAGINCDTKAFSDKVDGKSLEIELIAEYNDMFEVLLREVNNGVPNSSYINEELCPGIDLNKAKEEVTRQGQRSGNIRQVEIHSDYISFDSKWNIASYETESKLHVIVTWFTNPNNFYCQAIDKEIEFRAMMNEIQGTYANKEPIKCGTLQVGSPVIAIFADDQALYRAEIIQVNKSGGHLVQYIDFGNSAIVEESKIFPVEKRFIRLPKLAIHCTLENIMPINGLDWSTANEHEIDVCFNADKYECIFRENKNNKYIITLNINGQNVAETLVNKSLASYNIIHFVNDELLQNNIITDENSTANMFESQNVEKIDITLLYGQALRVKVSYVESAFKFYVQFPSATETQNIINAFMATKNPQVMPHMSVHEVCLGAGCLVSSNGIWRRAVVITCSEFTSFDVKLIDTGENYGNLDCVLTLPSELSGMQNQAIECRLQPESQLSCVTKEKLQELIDGKEVIIVIDDIQDSLVVTLFNSLGSKIDVTNDTSEKTSPICQMPIFSSTHTVTVSYASHSGSVWLQRSSDYETDTNLIQSLEEYYSQFGKVIEPQPGLLCAAKSADGHWYRAKIIKCTQTTAYVTFIDYGNGEEIAFNTLMELDPQFYIPHQLAINVSLTVTLNGTESEQIQILQAHLCGKELVAIFYNVHKKWVVELIDNGDKISEKFRSFNLIKGVAPAPPLQCKVDAPIGSTYTVRVSHTDSPSQFWLQCMDEADILDQKQTQLQIDITQFPLVNGILEEGTLCAAVYSIDNLWYRAEVLDADEDITTVRFIDFGNTDVIDNKSEKIRQLDETWTALKPFATKCRLDVISVDSEDWSTATCEKFENLVTSTDFLHAVVIANSMPKRVDLFIEGKSIREILVAEHHAIMIQIEEELIDEIVDLELDPHSAFVSHINSPSEFWVQEEKSIADLEVMSDRFMVADMFPKVDEITEGLLCVAKYPEDELWYRARVISYNQSGTEVRYIDYGNSAVSTEVRAIPDDLANLSPLSRKCRLAFPQGIAKWSDKACKMFDELAADGATIFLLDILKEDETSLVKLTYENKNVADILANLCEQHLPVIEERLPPLGEENTPNVVISHVNSLSEFWVQAESSITDLEVMSDRLQAAPSFLPLTNFESGTICAAQYPEDEQWYRAKILSHGDDVTKVLYIDYGNSAVTTELRVLPEDIVNIPILSKQCTLEMPSSIQSRSQKACDTFKDLAAEGATMFQFEILEDGEPVKVRLSVNGKNVVDILFAESNNEQFGENETIELPPSADICEERMDIIDANEEDTLYTTTNSEQILENLHEETIENIQTAEPPLNGNNIISNVINKQDENMCHQTTEESIVRELTVDDIVENMVKDVTDDIELQDRTANNPNIEKISCLGELSINNVKEAVKNSSTEDVTNTINNKIEQNMHNTPNVSISVLKSDSLVKDFVEDNTVPASTESVVQEQVCSEINLETAAMSTIHERENIDENRISDSITQESKEPVSIIPSVDSIQAIATDGINIDTEQTVQNLKTEDITNTINNKTEQNMQDTPDVSISVLKSDTIVKDIVEDNTVPATTESLVQEQVGSEINLETTTAMSVIHKRENIDENRTSDSITQESKEPVSIIPSVDSIQAIATDGINIDAEHAVQNLKTEDITNTINNKTEQNMQDTPDVSISVLKSDTIVKDIVEDNTVPASTESLVQEQVCSEINLETTTAMSVVHKRENIDENRTSDSITQESKEPVSIIPSIDSIQAIAADGINIDAEHAVHNLKAEDITNTINNKTEQNMQDTPDVSISVLKSDTIVKDIVEDNTVPASTESLVQEQVCSEINLETTTAMSVVHKRENIDENRTSDSITQESKEFVSIRPSIDSTQAIAADDRIADSITHEIDALETLQDEEIKFVDASEEMSNEIIVPIDLTKEEAGQSFSITSPINSDNENSFGSDIQDVYSETQEMCSDISTDCLKTPLKQQIESDSTLKATSKVDIVTDLSEGINIKEQNVCVDISEPQNSS